MKRIFALFACIWLAACAAPGAPPRLSPGDAAPVIKIGLIAPFEGLGRPLGYGVLPEVKSAIEAANSSGALGPYRVALVALNDDLDPAAAAAQAAALSQDPDIIAVLGPFTSDTAAAAAPVLSAAHIPVLLAAPALFGSRSLCPPPDEIRAVLEAEAAAEASNFIVSDCLSCSHYIISNPFISPNHPRRFNSTTHSALSEDRIQMNSDPVIFFPGDAEDAADEVVARRVEGWSGMLFGGPDVLKPWFPQRAGAAGEGTRAVACVLSDSATPAATLPEAALARAGTEIILKAMAQVVQEGRRVDRATISAALASTEIAQRLTQYEVRDGVWSRQK